MSEVMLKSMRMVNSFSQKIIRLRLEENTPEVFVSTQVNTVETMGVKGVIIFLLAWCAENTNYK